MKTYEFNLKHDKGSATVRVSAETLAAAQATALDVEKAPPMAIQWWRVVPTPKQITKTKNLLRSL